MPVNSQVLQELIKKYGIDKIRSAKDNIASRRQQKMFDRVSEKIANQKLPGEIKDEPLVPMEQEIMSYTDAGDPMRVYEAGQMVANGDILPGIGMMALTLAPAAVQKYLVNKEISGIIKDSSRKASTKSSLRGGDASFSFDASPVFPVSSSDFSLTRASSYSGYTPTSPSKGNVSFVEDIDELVDWSMRRGNPQKSSTSLIKLDPDRNKYIGSGKESIVYSDPDNPDMVLKVMRGKAVPGDNIYTMPHFDSPEEAVKWAEERTALKNSRPYNLVENIVGVTGNKSFGYMPVTSQKKVIPANKYLDKTGFEIDADIRRFGERIGDRGLVHAAEDDVGNIVQRRVNNAIYENDFNVVFKNPYDGKLYFETKDLRPENVGYLPNGELIGLDVFTDGGLLKDYGSGGKIHIKPSKRGTFTAAAKKHGKSVQAFASQVLAHKENYSPAMVKKANFARNSAKWHEDGGFLQQYPDGGRIKGKNNGKYFVTELNDRREKKFQDWYANAASILGLDPNPDAYEQAYDYRGYWLNNRDADVSSPDFHFPDTWKQPHHPTFSDESIYAKGHEGVGHWNGDTFVPGPFNNIIRATEPTAAVAPIEPTSYGSNYVPSEDILQYIKDTEAFRDQWYQDGNGVWTIGYGFTGDDVRKRYPNGMTRAEADKYFADTVSRRIPMFVGATPNFDRLNQNQRDALFSYYYNIGHGGYTRKSPAMQEALKNFDLDTVVSNIDFGYNDKKNRGLRKRRDYERKLFGTPMDYGGILDRLRNVYGDNESVKAAILRAKNVKK